jgi:hypothetical protein
VPGRAAGELALLEQSTSFSPSSARWYAVEQPAMPPPTTTMREELGSVMVFIVAASDPSYPRQSPVPVGELDACFEDRTLTAT